MSRDLENVLGGILLLAALGVFQWWSIRMGISGSKFWPWAAFRERSPIRFWTNIGILGAAMLVFLWIAVASLRRLLSQG